jgi:hypothetical protein
MGSAISRTQRTGVVRTSGDGTFTWRVTASIAAAAILSFFAYQIVFAPKIAPSLKAAIVLAIAAIGVAGIFAVLAPDAEEAPGEKLYTAEEVAQLLAAARSGRLATEAPERCKFCGGADAEATGVDGARYHRRCFREAFDRGQT